MRITELMEYFIKKAGFGHNGTPLVALFHSFCLSEEPSFSTPQELHGLWIQFPLSALKFLKKNHREARKGGSPKGSSQGAGGSYAAL